MPETRVGRGLRSSEEAALFNNPAIAQISPDGRNDKEVNVDNIGEGQAHLKRKPPKLKALEVSKFKFVPA